MRASNALTCTLWRLTASRIAASRIELDTTEKDLLKAYVTAYALNVGNLSNLSLLERGVKLFQHCSSSTVDLAQRYD